MPVPVVAILDIGKTNKKLFLFNENYEVVFEKSVLLKETTDEDGEVCEDIQALSTWVLEMVDKVLQNNQYQIKALNFSAYGASFVYLNKEGKPLAPLYNYLKKYPQKLHSAFLSKYNSDGRFFIDTASPNLESLNSGLQVYRLKYDQPAVYDQTTFALHLPQYLSYLFTQTATTDITSIGCHTALWDFNKNQYHHWVKEEQLNIKLPAICDTDSVKQIAKNNATIQVGIGLHDSSAALIPYLKYFKDPFVLISTGTWCISLNPFNDSPLTQDQLDNDCLCYMSYQGKPVKAARLFAGHEHEQVVVKLATHYNKPVDYYKSVGFNESLVNCKALQEEDKALKVGVHPSSFSNVDLNEFETYEAAYHAFMTAIIQQQKISTNLVLNPSIQQIFVDGGFSNNAVYMHLLATVFPSLKVSAALLPQSSSRGAAMVIHDSWNPESLPTNLIALKAYQAVTL